MQPVTNLPELEVKPPVTITTPCKPLLKYESNDTRDIIKTTVKNHNLYFLCASKMKSAIVFINNN